MRPAAPLALVCAFALALVPRAARADAITDVLGEAYANGTPAARLVLLAQARADNRLQFKESKEAVAEIATAYVLEGKTTKERLERLGALRKDVEAQLKQLNEARKAAKKRVVAPLEPDSAFQQAVSLDYVREVAGGRPTLEQLGCLALVRDATSWAATSKLVLACALEAFTRDEAFMKADHAEKLSIIKEHAEERAMLSDHERTVIENMVLGEWMSRRLAEGAAPEAIAAELRELKDRKKVCFFSYSWASDILESLTALRARAKAASGE